MVGREYFSVDASLYGPVFAFKGPTRFFHTGRKGDQREKDVFLFLNSLFMCVHGHARLHG